MSIKISGNTVHIANYTVDDPAVVAAFAAAEEAGRDLEEFLGVLLSIGAQAATLSSNTAGAEKIEASLAQTKEAIQNITETVEKSVDAKIAAVTADDGQLAKNIDGALGAFRANLEKLIAGEDAPVRKEILKSLEESQTKIRDDFARQVTAQRDQIAKLLDPAEPTSPLRGIVASIDGVAAQIKEVRESQLEVSVREAALEPGVSGGNDYEDDVFLRLQQIAGFAGDDCQATGKVVGRIPRSKKGDAVVDLKRGASVYSRLVMEAKNQAMTIAEWEAEVKGSMENRAAAGFIGLCKHLSDMPNGNRLLVLAPNVIVLAYNPEEDSGELLVMVYQLVKMICMSHTGQLDEISIADVNANVDIALKAIDKFDSLSRNVSAIKNSADKILAEANEIRARVGDSLTAIQTAILRGSEPPVLESAVAAMEIEES